MNPQHRIVAGLDTVQADVDALKRLQVESRHCLHPFGAVLLPAILDKALR